MKTLHIQVVDKVATYQMRDGAIICGNDDYQVEFTFDAEWNEHTKKTARFIWNGQYFDQEFTGTTCPVPVLNNTDSVVVGVYVGESADDAILSTTRERIPCVRSIRCGNAAASNGTGENYTNEARGYAEEAKRYAEALENAEGALTLKAESYVGESYCGGQSINVTGLMEEGHVYLLVFRYIGDVFSFILPTYASGGEGRYRGCFGGYNEMYNTNTPVHPYFVSGWVEGPDESGEWVSNQVCEVTLLDETNQNVTLTVTGSGDYYMQVYKLV